MNKEKAALLGKSSAAVSERTDCCATRDRIHHPRAHRNSQSVFASLRAAMLASKPAFWYPAAHEHFAGDEERQVMQ